MEATEHFGQARAVSPTTPTVGSLHPERHVHGSESWEANQPGVPTAFFGSAIDNSKPGSPAFQANALLYDGQVSFLTGGRRYQEYFRGT